MVTNTNTMAFRTGLPASTYTPPAQGPRSRGGARGKYQSPPPGLNSKDRYDNIRIIEQQSGKFVNFKVSPEISESKNALYLEVGDIRSSASIMVFLGSPSRNYSVNAKLVSRTADEAAENFAYMNLLKSWAMPHKGLAQSAAAPVGNRAIGAGDEPPVLHIYGYGEVFRAVQVVMKNINIEYPTDVDYISGNANVKLNANSTLRTDFSMPIIMTIGMTFQEIRSSDEMQEFKIDDYKAGTLEYW